MFFVCVQPTRINKYHVEHYRCLLSYVFMRCVFLCKNGAAALFSRVGEEARKVRRIAKERKARLAEEQAVCNALRLQVLLVVENLVHQTPPTLASRFRGVREATIVMEFASVPAMLRSAQRGGVELLLGIERSGNYRGADGACFGDHLDDAALQGRPQ